MLLPARVDGKKNGKSGRKGVNKAIKILLGEMATAERLKAACDAFQGEIDLRQSSGNELGVDQY